MKVVLFCGSLGMLLRDYAENVGAVDGALEVRL